jgi:iron complex outermembrane receptor protein
MLNYDAFAGSSTYSFTGAWLLSRLNYVNRLASIDSRNNSDILILKAALENPISENTKLRIVIDDQSGFVKSNNYKDNITRNTATLAISIDRKINRFGTTLLLREILDKDNLLFPDFTAGAQFRLTEDKEYYLKANLSRNSKIPSMNEMYWVPGGNPDLKNEYALMYEISYEMKQNFSDHMNLKYDLSVFRYNIKDMILWHPGVYSYWTADNIQNVITAGGESSLSLDYVLNDLNAAMKAAYSFTRASSVGSKIENDVSEGKQLMYTPENQANASLKIGYKNMYLFWIANFTGKRFITVDNLKYLPGYLINNLSTGIKFKLKSSSVDVNFCIDNLFNIYYQSIAYYPLPGRSYLVKFLFQIVK